MFSSREQLIETIDEMVHPSTSSIKNERTTSTTQLKREIKFERTLILRTAMNFPFHRFIHSFTHSLLHFIPSLSTLHYIFSQLYNPPQLLHILKFSSIQLLWILFLFSKSSHSLVIDIRCYSLFHFFPTIAKTEQETK